MALALQSDGIRNVHESALCQSGDFVNEEDDNFLAACFERAGQVSNFAAVFIFGDRQPAQVNPLFHVLCFGSRKD
jgi:hypothetical protein